jgi:hypothetical protein
MSDKSKIDYKAILEKIKREGTISFYEIDVLKFHMDDTEVKNFIEDLERKIPNMPIM